MDFNPVKINYNENYTKTSVLGSVNGVVVEHMNGSLATRRFTSPHTEQVKYYTSRVLKIEKLNTSWRKVYRVKFEKVFSFTPGDSIGILCPNNDSFVNYIMDVLGIKDFSCKIERTGCSPFTYTGTITDFFKHHFDFCCVQRKSLLMRLSENCTEINRKHIEYLCSREGTKDYLQIGKNWNNILDFMKTFGCKPKIEDLLCDCEIIKPRYFSLVNKIEEHAEVLVGICSVFLDGFVRYGHVSWHLECSNLTTAGICLRENVLFQMDVNEEKMLAICTGTGIAPFLSFALNLNPHQSIWLIHGFRDHEDDLSAAIAQNNRIKITKVSSSCGTRVTDYIRSNIDILKEYIDEKCPVYVCGRMAMQRQIFDIFKNEFEDVVESKRLVFDTWS